MKRPNYCFLFVLLAVFFLPATTPAMALELGASYNVLMTNGRVYTGTLVAEGENSIALKLQGDKTVTIPREEIEAIRKSKNAAMKFHPKPVIPAQAGIQRLYVGPSAKSKVTAIRAIDSLH